MTVRWGMTEAGVVTATAAVPLCAVNPWTPQPSGTAGGTLRKVGVPLALGVVASPLTAATTATLTKADVMGSLVTTGSWATTPPNGYTGNAFERGLMP